MTENLLLLNWLVSIGALFLEIFLVLFILFIFYFKNSDAQARNKIKVNLQTFVNQKKKNLEKFGIDIRYDVNNLDNIIIYKIVFLTFLSSFMTLLYSEYFGVIPCALCWFERVFMYGILIISITALFARNQLEQSGILRYIAVFSVLGAVVSLYHHVLQMTASATSHLPCPASGGDCAKRVIFEFGHITFPWLAFIMFLTFIAMIYFAKEIKKD